MADIREARKALVMRILEGDGEASRDKRRAAFDNSGIAGPAGAMVEKVAGQASRVADEDFIAVKASGLSEDQIFELVVCAAVGQASRQYERALSALESATGTE
jgi:hypothetical protein